MFPLFEKQANTGHRVFFFFSGNPPVFSEFLKTILHPATPQGTKCFSLPFDFHVDVHLVSGFVYSQGIGCVCACIASMQPNYVVISALCCRLQTPPFRPRPYKRPTVSNEEKLQVHIPQRWTPFFPPTLPPHTYSMKRHESTYMWPPSFGGRRRRRSGVRRRSVFTAIMLLFLCHKMGRMEKTPETGSAE